MAWFLSSLRLRSRYQETFEGQPPPTTFSLVVK
jgi:hypothetical protein